jgi:type I restriction enzyme S subunit
MKPGYKQTEVGVIPEEWEVKSLGDIASLYQPVTISAKQFTESGYPVYGANGVVGFYHSPNHRTRQVTVTCRGSTCGTVNRTVDECWITGNAMVLNCDHNQNVSKDFFYFLLLGQDMSDCITGTGQPQIVRSPLAAFRVPLPNTLHEQRAIATALSDVDGLLGALDRLIAKKRDLKQAAMQQLLPGQTRLPGFHGEWEVKRLEEVAPLQRGFDLPNPQIKSGPYPVVYSNGILNHHAAFQVKGPGVVTGRSGTIGKVTFVEDDYWPHNTSLWVTSFKGNDPKFIFYLYTRLGFERFASGSGVPTLNRNDAHSFQVLIAPTKAEQTAIASVLSEMDAELAALEQRREKTRALKQGMMQELLTGRTRLPDKL